MTLYQALQLNAKGSKDLIRSTSDAKERRKWQMVYLFKVFITVAFCFLFVTGFSLIFGPENSIAGVSILLILFLVRQADFGINMKSSILALFLLFVILAAGPKAACLVPPVGAFFIHLICIFLITLLGCHNIIMSNHFTFVLSYLLLSGYEVSGRAFLLRLSALAAGFVMCALIFYRNHRQQHFKRGLRHLLDELDLTSSRTQWQIRISLAASSAMLAASLLGIPRVMWIGIACMSIMTPLIRDCTYRELRRAPFNIVGGLLFLALYRIMPEGLLPFMGIIGGICVGFSASYSFQTIFNTLGALLIAAELFGPVPAVILRIFANAFATVYCIGFNVIWEKIRNLRFYHYKRSI